MNALTEFLSGLPHILPPPDGRIAQVIMLVAFIVPIAMNVSRAFIDFVNRSATGVSAPVRKPHEWITEPAPKIVPLPDLSSAEAALEAVKALHIPAGQLRYWPNYQAASKRVLAKNYFYRQFHELDEGAVALVVEAIDACSARQQAEDEADSWSFENRLKATQQGEPIEDLQDRARV